MKLNSLLNKFREPLELQLSEAQQVFKEQKSSDIEAVEKKTEEFKAGTRDELQDLESVLTDLEDYSDYKSRSVVEDVVENIIEERRRGIEDFEVHDDPEKLHQELQEFIMDFQSMSQKEAAVMDEVPEEKAITPKLQSLKKHREKLEEFLESKFEIKKNYRDLKESVDRLENLQEERKEIEEELEANELEPKQSKLEELEEDIDKLHDSEEWKEYENLKEEVSRLRSEKSSKENELGKAMQKMERGLKKLVYSIENGDVDSGIDVQILKDLRDGRKEEILEREPEKVETAVEKSIEILPGDLLDSTEKEKLSAGVETFSSIKDYRDELDRLKEEVANKKRQIKEHKVLDKESSLESSKRQLRREIKQLKDKREELEERKDEIGEEIETTEDKIRDLMDDSVTREVKFN